MAPACPYCVRGRPAQSGALRLRNEVGRDLRGDVGQGAPSTIRCIETAHTHSRLSRAAGQGAPSTIRCVQYLVPEGRVVVLGPSAKGWRPAGAAVAPRAGAPSAALRLLSAVRCAHKGPELGNAVGTQGRNQAVVRGVVLRNSILCVRNRDLRTTEEHPSQSGASDQEPETLAPGQRQYRVGGSALRCYDSGVPGRSGGPGWMLH